MSKHANEELRRAAILIASLDTATADQLLEQMPDQQARRVRDAVLALGRVDPAERQRVRDAFVASRSKPAPIEDSVELSADLVRQLDEAGDQPENTGPQRFAALQQADDRQLLTLIGEERPQIIALVLAHLSDQRSARILSQLPAEVQVAVVRRLTRLHETDPEILAEIERSLETRFAELLPDEAQQARLENARRILSAAEPSVRAQLLKQLTADDQELAQILNAEAAEPALLEPYGTEMVYTFQPQSAEAAPSRPEPTLQSLDELEPQDLAHVIAAANPEVARLALAGWDPALVEQVMSWFPADQQQAWRHAVDNLGAIPLSDVAEAQDALLDVAHGLIAAGHLSPPPQLRLAA